jgi:hypothetical protein
MKKNYFKSFNKYALLLVTIWASVMLLSGVAFGATANDLCANATTVVFTVRSYTNSINTGSNGNSHTDYGSGVRNVGGSDAYWLIPAAAQARTYTVDTNGSGYDTVLHIYKACSNVPGHSNIVARDDDSGSGRDSALTFTSTVGQAYIVVVDRYANGNRPNFGGATQLNISYPEPTNDTCAQATEVAFTSGTYTNTVSTTNNDNSHTSTGCGSVAGRDAFWKIPSDPSARTILVDTNGSNYDTVVNVYRTGTCTLTGTTRVDCDDDSGTGLQSALTFTAAAGETYIVVIDGYGSGAGGSATINIEVSTASSGSHRAIAAFGALTDGQITISHGADPRRGTTYEGNIQVWYNDGISRPGGGSPAIPRIQVYWPTQDSTLDERGGDSGIALRLSNGSQWGTWGEASGINATLGDNRLVTAGTGTTGQVRVGNAITSHLLAGNSSDIHIDQVVDYTAGESHFDIKWKIWTDANTYSGVRFLHDVDTFTSGNDFGYGYRCGITKIVGGTGGRRFFQGLIALRPSDKQSEDNWYNLHIKVRNGDITQGTVAYQDNGMGHQWNDLTINTTPIYLVQRWTFDDPIRLSSYGTPVSLLAIADESFDTVFDVVFDKTDWKGELRAHSLPFDAGATPIWQAGALLSARDYTDRTVYTNGGGFLLPFTAVNTGLSENLVNFIKGDHTNELMSNADLSVDITTTTQYRNRSNWKLGDIAHSNPVYVPATPSLPFTSNDYETWAAGISRDAVIYVGANDGMLHAFDAATGVEKWAFVPDAILSRLDKLGKTYYEQLRLPMVDLTPISFDVYVEGSWKTILLIGLREGGEAYYCLDVTDPDNPSFMWVFTDPDMANAWSKPSVARIDTGSERWVAVFGSGYRSHAADQASKTAYIYVTDIADGSQVRKIQLSTTQNNVVSGTVSVDEDNDGNVDRAYFGDLTGKLWRLDLSSTSPASWTTSILFQAGSEVTITESGYSYGSQEYTYNYWTQPISMTPIVTTTDDDMSESSNDNKPIVIFGTGKFDSFYDNYSTDTQYIYGVIDRDGTSTVTNSELYAQTVTTTTLSGEDVRTISGDDIGTQKGWRVELVSSGERMPNDGEIFSGILFLTSMIPDSTQFCDASGEGWLYVLDYRTGGSPDDVLIDVNEDNAFDDSDRVGGEGGQAVAARRFTGGIISSPILDLKRNRAIVKVGDTIEASGIKLPSGIISSNLIYWREVF